MKSEPLIESLPAPGKIVSITENPLYNTQEWTLSNGVKVVVKKTDFKENEILFNALALGGTSVLGAEDDLNLRYLPYAIGQHGLGTYSSSDLENISPESRQVAISSCQLTTARSPALRFPRTFRC